MKVIDKKYFLVFPDFAIFLDLGSSALGRGSSNLPSRTSGNCKGLAQAGANPFFWLSGPDIL